MKYEKKSGKVESNNRSIENDECCCLCLLNSIYVIKNYNLKVFDIVNDRGEHVHYEAYL